MERELRALLLDAVETGEVHWMRAPDDTALPYVTMQVVSQNGDHTQSGPVDLKEAIVQVDAWAASYTEAADLRDDILAIDGYSGSDAIKAILLEMVQSALDTSTVNNIYRQMIRYRVFYK
ncbi:tail completion protein gp17 [Paracoccus sp. (in: a-proteobacteria)]|uniref:tail completion protein gp17 n=1 Tax=Paracoccus sp. TaxID=267 RepID=UPI004058623D